MAFDDLTFRVWQALAMSESAASEPLVARSRPRIVAHRGASADFPENTIEAFVGAEALGADGIELDVRRTADDVLVIHHDVHLADGRMVRGTASADLPPSVPTLAEALEATGDLWVNVEVKNHPSDPDFDAEHGISIAVAALIDAFDVRERVLVSSFDLDSVLRIRDADPTIPLGWLVWGQADPMQLLSRAKARGMEAIHPHDLLVDAAFVAEAHRIDVAVNVWTVDDVARIQSLAAMGVDAIITNVPDVALAALS